MNYSIILFINNVRLIFLTNFVLTIDQFRYEQLSRLHELYNGKVGVPKHVPNNFNHSTLPTRMQSASLSDVFKNGITENPSTNHDFTHASNDFDNNSIASEPAYLLVCIYFAKLSCSFNSICSLFQN